MPNYKTTWLDGELPTGRQFAVAVCGYSGKVRHMTIGDDPMRRALVRFETVEDGRCNTAEHCLATDCALNRTQREHALHMLDMYYDEKLDTETAEAWDTVSVVDGLLRFAQKLNEDLPAELRKGMNLFVVEDSETK